MSGLRSFRRTGGEKLRGGKSSPFPTELDRGFGRSLATRMVSIQINNLKTYRVPGLGLSISDYLEKFRAFLFHVEVFL